MSDALKKHSACGSLTGHGRLLARWVASSLRFLVIAILAQAEFGASPIRVCSKLTSLQPALMDELFTSLVHGSEGDDGLVRVALPKAVGDTWDAASKMHSVASHLAVLEWRAAGMFRVSEDGKEWIARDSLFMDVLSNKVDAVPESAEEAHWLSTHSKSSTPQPSSAGSLAPSDSLSNCTLVGDRRMEVLNALEGADSSEFTGFPKLLASSAMPFGRHLFIRSRVDDDSITQWYCPFNNRRVPNAPNYEGLPRTVVPEGVLQAIYLVDDLPYTPTMRSKLVPIWAKERFTGIVLDALLDVVRAFYGCAPGLEPAVLPCKDGDSAFAHGMNYARYADILNKPVLMLLCCSRVVSLPEQLALAEEHCAVSLTYARDPQLFYNNNKCYLIPNERSGCREEGVPLAWMTEHRLQSSGEYIVANQQAERAALYLESRMLSWIQPRYLNASLAPVEGAKPGSYLDSPHDELDAGSAREVASAPGALESHAISELLSVPQRPPPGDQELDLSRR